MSSLAERVLKVFSEALSVPEGTDTETLIYNEFANWDSIAHMTLVAALETEFDCMMDMEHILDMSSYGKAIEIMGGYVE